VFDHAERRRRLSERMREEGVDLLYLGLSSDLEYLPVSSGHPFFGQSFGDGAGAVAVGDRV
jgi:hypothetical protein